MTLCYGEDYGESFGCGFALRFGLWVEMGRNKRTSKCELRFLYSEQIEGGRQWIEGGRQNGLRVATNQTERRRQTVLETVYSKFTLHITQFPHC